MKKTEKRRLVGSIVLAFGVAVLLLWIPFWEVSGALATAMGLGGTPFICGAIIGILNKRYAITIAVGFATTVTTLIVANALWSGTDIELWAVVVVFLCWITWTNFGSMLARWLS